MKLEVIRYNFKDNYTGGMLLVNGVFKAYTLEDTYRDVKVMHETCIPEGNYSVELRTVGGFHNKYDKRYHFHKGMLWVKDVPNFEYILIHTGNTPAHTSGCLLLGNTPDVNRAFIGNSREVYASVYPEIADAILRGEDVCITYKNI